MEGIVMVGKKLLIVMLLVTASSFALPEKFTGDQNSRHEKKHDCFKDIKKNDPNTIYKFVEGADGKLTLQKFDTSKNEQQMSAARAFGLSFVIGAGTSIRFGNGTKNHLLGYLLAGGSNAFIGQVAFQDRNYWTQFLGISVGYAVGVLLPTIVRSADDINKIY